MRSRGPDRAHGARPALAALAAALAVSALPIACSDPDRDRLKATTRATYDPASGRLTELTFDSNRNGRIDTWTEMDGPRAVRSRLDRDEDGRMDRWEYYDAAGRVAKVGFSRKNDGKPDAWAYSNGSGKIIRVDVSSHGDENRIDRWEVYDPQGPAGPDGVGPLAQVVQDTNGDGKRDKWERYRDGQVLTAEFDEDGDERPDRRLTYSNAALVSIETGPDGRGGYAKKVRVE
jgi:hypothetical protein